MPVILNAEIDLKNRFKYSTISNSDDKEYSMYFEIGNNFIYQKFDDSYITESKSLFYEYNLKLKSYILFKMIEKQVKKLY